MKSLCARGGPGYQLDVRGGALLLGAGSLGCTANTSKGCRMRGARSTSRRIGWLAGRPSRSAETTSWSADDGNRAEYSDASIGLRLRVFLRRRRLDQQIAAGFAGDATPVLELRILQLTDVRSQRTSARSLRRFSTTLTAWGVDPTGQRSWLTGRRSEPAARRCWVSRSALTAAER